MLTICDFLELNILMLVYKIIKNIYKDSKVALIFFIHLLNDHYNVNASIKDIDKASLLSVLSLLSKTEKYNQLLKKIFDKQITNNANEDMLFLTLNKTLKTLLEKYEDQLTILLAISFLFYLPLTIPAIIFNVPLGIKVVQLILVGVIIVTVIILLNRRII